MVKHDLTRFIQKIAEKLPFSNEENVVFTDIHVRVSQDTGDVMAFNDDNKEITRIVVEEWINSPLEVELFYDMVHKSFVPVIEQYGTKLGVAKPYNYVLEDESGEYISELYIVDESETMILCTPLIENLTDDLDKFIDNLLKDD